MCYVDMGPKGGYWRADNKESLYIQICALALLTQLVVQVGSCV